MENERKLQDGEWELLKDYLTLNPCSPKVVSILDYFDAGVKGIVPEIWLPSLRIIRDPDYMAYSRLRKKFKIARDGL